MRWRNGEAECALDLRLICRDGVFHSRSGKRCSSLTKHQGHSKWLHYLNERSYQLSNVCDQFFGRQKPKFSLFMLIKPPYQVKKYKYVKFWLHSLFHFTRSLMSRTRRPRHRDRVIVCYSFVCRRNRQDPNAGNIRVAEQRKGRKRRRRTSQCSSDMELGHWVTGSIGHLGYLSRPGHRVIILTRCETRVFPVFEFFLKNAQNAKRTLEMLK